VTSRHCTGFERRIIVDLGELHIIKAAVLTIALHQLIVTSLFYNTTIRDNYYSIRILDG
jgi:hypothetical protein